MGSLNDPMKYVNVCYAKGEHTDFIKYSHKSSYGCYLIIVGYTP